MSTSNITPPASPERQQTPPPSRRTPDSAEQKTLDIFKQSFGSPNRSVDSPPRTPPRNKYSHILPIPPTPIKRKFIPESSGDHPVKRSAIEPFKALSLPLLDAKAPFPFTVSPHVDVKGYYKISSDYQKLCIKQPPQKQSCGTCATLMLLSHFIDLKVDIKLEESFWNYYVGAILINQAKIIESIETKTNITSCGYQVKGTYYHKQERIEKKLKESGKSSKIDYVVINNFRDDVLKRINLIQAEINSPIIVSITNPQIAGHWIVIDQIVKDGVFIRDPYTGKGYKLSLEELYQNWDVEDEIKIIYLKTTELS